MAKNSMKPQIRFKGFTDAWEQRKLKQVATIQKGEQLSKAKLDSVGKYYVLNGGMEPSGFCDEYNTEPNTISISEGGNSCGYVALNLDRFWSGGHNYTLQNLRIDTEFLFQCLKGIERKIMALRVGSGLPNIQKAAIDGVDIIFPLEDEQKSIGQFLTKLSNLITLHQCKRVAFMSRKSSSIFRFEKWRNTLTWEQRKLKQVATIQKGEQLSKAKLDSVGKYYVLNGGMEPSGFCDEYNTEPNTISISEGGNSCGYVALNLDRFWSGGHNYTLQNLRIDTEFLFQCLKGIERKIMALRVGSGLPNIQKAAIDGVDIIFPLEDEQKSIGQFLTKLSNLITLHQRGEKIYNRRQTW